MAQVKKSEADKLKKKRLLRVRFRTLLKLVQLNRAWLTEVEDTRITTDVKKNIAIIRRPRGTGVLTLSERTLILKPHRERTIEERRRLTHLFCNLKCFSFFSPKIRARLVPVITYMYLTTGRTVIREGHNPECLYFILSGEIDGTLKKYDKIKGQFYDEPLVILGSGDFFGEYGLLYPEKRHFTCKTTSDVELLTLSVEDFNDIVLDWMRDIWEKKKLAFQRYELLSNWRYPYQENITCKLTTIRKYESYETLYYEDKGMLEPVFFILTGQCMILQCLKMRVRVVRGEKCYELCAADKLKPEDKDMFHAAVVEGRAKSLKKKTFADISMLHELSVHEENSTERLAEFEGKENDVETQSSNFQFDSADGNVSNKVTKEYIESHFVDVGTMSAGALFGLGEPMVHRAIMAKGKVECILIPRYWLFETKQNPGNVWQRMLFYLGKTLPSREELFNGFLASEKWKMYKGEVDSRLFNEITTKNPTKVGDLPKFAHIIDGM